MYTLVVVVQIKVSMVEVLLNQVMVEEHLIFVLELIHYIAVLS